MVGTPGDRGASLNRVETIARGGVAILSLHGEHDLDNADAVREAADRVVANRQPCVFDLRNANFVDSNILAVLIGTQRRCRDHGMGFATVTTGDETNAVCRVLEVTGLGALLGAVTELERAIAIARR